MAVPSLRNTRNSVTDSANAGAAQASHADAANDMQVRTVHGELQSNLPYQSESSGLESAVPSVAEVRRRCACLAEARSAKANVENLLMDGEFPVEYTATKIFFLQDSARIVAESRSQAAFVLRFACFASRTA